MGLGMFLDESKKIYFYYYFVLAKNGITKFVILTTFVTATQPNRVILEPHLSY